MATLLTRILGVAPLAAVFAACPSSHGTPCRPGDACVVAGSGDMGSGGDGAAAREAELSLPVDVAVGPDGRLFVVDWNNNRIRVVNEDEVIEPFAGTGVAGAVRPGPAPEADLNHPTAVWFDAAGDVSIAVWLSGVIARVHPVTHGLEIVAGTGERDYHGDGAPAVEAAFDRPVSLADDGAGSLLVADQSNQVLRRIGPDGTITTVAGSCRTGTCDPEDQVDCPDSGKIACLADGDGCRRSCLGAYAGDGGPASEARFHFPWGAASDPGGRIASGPEGELYVADTESHRIRRIGSDGTVRTVAGTGERGTGGDGGPATGARLDRPADVAVGSDGTLFVADTGSSCIRAVSPDGVIRTVAGRCGEHGTSADGTAADDALLDHPYGIDVGPDGTLYVADTRNHRVLRVRPR